MVLSFRTLAATLAAGVLALGVAGINPASAAGSGWEGKYKTKDTQGNAMSITLAGDGTATADRSGEGLKGTWKEKDNVAVIDWNDDWMTKLAKDGSSYAKTAYRDGARDGASVSAEKIE